MGILKHRVYYVRYSDGINELCAYKHNYKNSEKEVHTVDEIEMPVTKRAMCHLIRVLSMASKHSDSWITAKHLERYDGFSVRNIPS